MPFPYVSSMSSATNLSGFPVGYIISDILIIKYDCIKIASYNCSQQKYDAIFYPIL